MTRNNGLYQLLLMVEVFNDNVPPHDLPWKEPALHRLIVLVFLFHGLVTPASAAAPLTYEADVRPILKAHCFQCHGEGGEKEGSLDLRLK
ncbi:MAG: hypothetical protein KDA84_03805, partial [Planctomycetaceae bacterium]|nr:hypothetical protein [Planctomycetaceae bacterium]